ncbi:MAG: hypothetical protein ACOCSJ_02625 [Candidatus Natronoplasma sp.]
MLMEAAEKIEVEDVYVSEYTTEIEEGSDNITKIEVELNIDIRNPTPTDVQIERLEYDLMIEPADLEQEDIEFDSGAIHHRTIHGGGVTTISMPIENEDEDNIEKIQDYLLEEEGELEAVTEIHVPLLQIVVDFPVTAVSEQLRETFVYEPVLEGYDVEDQNATLEKAEEADDADHVLKIPYEIETNENEFLSGEVLLETNMESFDGEITSSDSIMLDIGDNKEGNFTFGLDENDSEELLTEEQNIEFSSDITLDDDISFEEYHDRSIESPAMLEDFEVDEDNATLEEAGDDDNSDYVLKTPYEIITNDNEFISGVVEIDTTMTDYVNITSNDHIDFEIGEDKDGYLRFGLDEDDVEELLTEDQTIEFYSDITSSEGDVSFDCDHDSVHSKAMLVEYEIEGDEAELDEVEEHLEIPYYIETQETAFFEEGGNISINTTMESEDGTIRSSTTFDIEIGETEEGNLIFELDDDEVNELRDEDKTLQFTSDVERDNISFEYDHEEEGEWIAPS